MSVYKAMYHKLFAEMCDTIDRFQEILLEVEEMYMAQQKRGITVVRKPRHKKEKENPQ